MTRAASITSTTTATTARDDVSVLSRGSTLRPRSAWASSLTLLPFTSKKKGDKGDDAEDQDKDEDGDEQAHNEEEEANCPSTFTFGPKRVEPFVSLDQLESHLKVMAAFHSLRERCRHNRHGDKSTTARGKGKENEEDQPWTMYLMQANDRFDQYIERVLTWRNLGVDPDSRSAKDMLDLDSAKAEEARASIHFYDLKEEMLPPLDVAMMWHAYRLNPGRLLEDAARVPSLRILSRVNFPLELLSQRLNAQTMQLESKPAETFWTETTGLSFLLDPSMSTPASSTKKDPTAPDDDGQGDPTLGRMIECPVCITAKSGPQRHFLPWDKLSRPGGWKFRCERCQSRVTPDVLQGYRFYQDLQAWLEDGSGTFRMRGGLLSPRNGKYYPDDAHAPILCRLYPYRRLVDAAQEGMDALVRFPPQERTKAGWAKTVKTPYPEMKASDHFEEAGGSLNEMATILQAHVLEREAVGNESIAIDLRRRLSLLFKFYREGDAFSPCSLDLVEAVKRQFSFVDEMHGMGWTSNSGTFEKEGDVTPSLARSIVRYHKWLNVLFIHKELLCPTLDIDLSWHTHQLSCSYQLDCFRILNFFVDHDDKIEATTLGKAFDNTGRLWYDMYQQPYSLCGCAVHAGAGGSSASRIKKLTSILGGSRGRDKSSSKQSSNDGEKRPATHPSEHNLVHSKDSRVSDLLSDIRLTKERKDTEKGRRAEGHPDPFM